jgi:alpha-galactosidase
MVHRYWGAKLPRTEDYPVPLDSEGWASFNAGGNVLQEEYPVYGGPNYVEPCLKVTFSDGVRDTVFKFVSAAIQGQTLTLTFRDTYYPLRLDLIYTIYPHYDLIGRSAQLTNEGGHVIQIERLFSAQWHLPARRPEQPYHLTYLTGKWIEEFQTRREALQEGVKVLESRRITTSHHFSPYFALDDGTASETNGDVWFGALAWSGNWKLLAEVNNFYGTRVGIGLNDWDSLIRLNATETFTTPVAYGGYSSEGHGAASRHLHRYIRETLIPHRVTPHKVIYNSWEATTFHVNEAGQSQLAELAAQMGIELFVMDDGWFHGRTIDQAGLGDWWADEQKFPNGLMPLIQRVNALGMDFGLWVEPEMVSPNSDLYRAHPDWVIHFPTRARSEMRTQLILNLAKREVQDYLLEKLDRLLSDHPIKFIKWDMNRNISEPGWLDAPPHHDPRELWVRYVEGVYRLWSELTKRHPSVYFQSCSGGGGRADLGILRYADQIWVSDNTDAVSRLTIQEGFSRVFPAIVMESWVTDAGHGTVPLTFRLHVSMCGSLGIGGHLLHWTPEERAEAQKWIAYYKTIRHIVQGGDLYRLLNFTEQAPFAALQYVTADKTEGVVFAFRTYTPQFLAAYDESIFIPPLRLKGLDPEGIYTVEGVAGERSGKAWEQVGLRVVLPNFGSTVRRIQRVR